MPEELSEHHHLCNHCTEKAFITRSRSVSWELAIFVGPSVPSDGLEAAKSGGRAEKQHFHRLPQAKQSQQRIHMLSPLPRWQRSSVTGVLE